MPTIDRVRVTWSGAPVTGPGLSTFYFNGGTADPAAISALFTSIAPYVAAGVGWNIPGAGDQLDVATGALTGSWSAAGGSLVASSGNAEHAQGVGCRIKWLTNGRRNNRRITGSTFIVPLSGDSYAEGGGLNSDAASAIGPKAYDLWTTLGGDMLVWSRPKPGEMGFVNSVVGVELSMDVTWLRSRRT